MSRLRARWFVGADFFARIGALRTDVTAPKGLVDKLEDLGRPGLSVSRIDSAVVPFFLNPGSLQLRIRSQWHGVFALLWRLLRPLLGVIGQLHLPLAQALITVRTVALDPARDGRADARGVIRSYDDGTVMQVMAYATHHHQGAGYMSTAFPLPLGALCGMLRLELIETGDTCGARLTSRRQKGSREPLGIFFAPLRSQVALRLPLEETLELWPAHTSAVPASLRVQAQPGDTLIGQHEQRFCGIRFATHAYWFSPLPSAPPRS